MPKPITVADAQALRKSLKDILDKYDNKKGSWPKQQLADYDTILRTAIKKISDLTA